MWKKRLITAVTFLGGIYFFLEFVIPATIPWQTTSGIVLSVPSDKKVEVGLVSKNASVPITEKTVIKRKTHTGEIEIASPVSIHPGDMVIIKNLSGKESIGIVMPQSSQRRLILGDVTKHKMVEVRDNSLVRRMRSRGSGEVVAATTLKASRIGSADWVQIGPTTYLSAWYESVNDFFVVLGSLAWGMGLLSLWLVHSGNIRKRRPEWYLSVLFFAAVIVGSVAGAGFGAPETSKEWTKRLSDIVLFDLLRPLGSTIFSLLTFYLASAAYRSFKAKSREAVLMMASSIIVILGQLSIHPTLTTTSTWILYIINSASVRALEFGLMLGAIAIGLRLWLSLERGAFFDREV
jgi:hypothetical protein